MAEPIRILHCFGRTDIGGAETMVMNIYRNIDRDKVQFDFVIHTKDNCAYDNEIISLGGSVYHVPRYKIFNHFTYLKAWDKIFKKYKDRWVILHAHVLTTAGFYLRVAKKNGIITIAHSHTNYWGNILSKAKIISRYLLKNNSDYLFACSEPAGFWLFGKKEAFVIIKNAIDLSKFVFDQNKRNKKRNEFQIEDKFVLGHIGNFIYYKNHDFIIEIFKAVYDKNEQAILMLVGDGNLRHDIEKKVHDLGLTDKVIFAGVRSDVPDLLQAMDVFIFPSLHEGLGLVTIEAQATGLHCIVADTIPKEAYVTELIEAESLKAPANQWAENILKYANGYLRIGKTELIKTKGYDIVETAKWLENFYLKEHEKLFSTKHN